MNTWVDFTRRNDPAHPNAVLHLRRMLLSKKALPDVFCFWTKNPEFIANEYANAIRFMRERGVLVLAQVTVTGYGQRLEPGVPVSVRVAPLVNLLGDGKVRLRFDPIIPGFTRPKHLNTCLQESNGIDVITVNFFEGKYKGTGKYLHRAGIQYHDASREEKVAILYKLRERIPDRITIALCAECAKVFGVVNGQAVIPDGFKKAACADATWAQRFRSNLRFTTRASRPGCGCCYTGDWGTYRSRGGYRCPHNCIYCYAK